MHALSHAPCGTERLAWSPLNDTGLHAPVAHSHSAPCVCLTHMPLRPALTTHMHTPCPAGASGRAGVARRARVGAAGRRHACEEPAAGGGALPEHAGGGGGHGGRAGGAARGGQGPAAPHRAAPAADAARVAPALRAGRIATGLGIAWREVLPRMLPRAHVHACRHAHVVAVWTEGCC